MAKVRGSGQVVDKLVELTVKACGPHRRYNLAVANGGDSAGMERVKEKLTAALPGCEHLWSGRLIPPSASTSATGCWGAAVQVLD